MTPRRLRVVAAVLVALVLVAGTAVLRGAREGGASARVPPPATAQVPPTVPVVTFELPPAQTRVTVAADPPPPTTAPVPATTGDLAGATTVIVVDAGPERVG